MQQLELTIHNVTGLHARPARVFVDVAKQYQSLIQIRYGEKHGNAKSLISVLKLGVAHGQQIKVEVSGEDEEHAAAAIVAAVQNGLGESIESAAAHAAPAEAAPPAASPSPTSDALLAVPVAQDGASGASNVIHGVAGAPGIAVGPVYRFERTRVEVRDRSDGVDAEQRHLNVALAAAQEQLVALHKQMVQRADATEAAIFEVHRDILGDAELLGGARGAIAEGHSAAAAWQRAYSQQADEMAQLADKLLAERATDVRDVGERVLRLLVGASAPAPALPDEPVIIVAYDLTPSETAAFDPQRVLGFCTAVGGPHAHTAILARALGLPAVVSAGTSVLEIAPGTQMILDGVAGTLLIAPDAQAIVTAQQQQHADRARRAAAAQSAADPAITTDYHRVEVVANIGGVDDARKAATCGAEGVGLLRTEFLFLDRTTAPTEDEQFEVYRDIAQALGDQPVIIRTLDIGGDKPLAYLDLPSEENPFLGERGIRLCLAHPTLLKQQLRAIFRAASHGRLRIMFPMIADVGELRAVRAIIEEIRAELSAPAVEIGIMVEIPSAALMADVLADEVDFFSVGTNDLTQYTLAMDRTHPKLAAQADGLHPAVLRLIARTAEAAHAAGKWIGVCGELGSDAVAVPILIGLGVDELSVSVPSIPSVKAQIRSLSLAQCREHAQRSLKCATAKQVRELSI